MGARHFIVSGHVKRKAFLFIIGALVLSCPIMAGTIDVATIEGGKVKGTTTDIPGVQVYKGIPFAATTAGKNRWAEPQPVEHWTGIKDCSVWGDQVVQDVNMNPVGAFWGDEFYFDPSFAPKASESGLNLNVYTPAVKPSDKLPVLVYIHGGGNNHGHASEMEFYASKLAKKGIIVVTVQYRVSLFGFLALDELSKESPHGVSGNYAILDLVKALAWVKTNIAAFGGDPTSVTISGQSAGAFNVTALLRTPLAKGLFKRAIIQSGFNGLLTDKKAPVYYPLKDQEAACKQAITAAFGKEMSLADLRAIPAEDFMTRKTPDGKQSVYDAITNAALAHGFGYTLDGYVFTEQSVDLTREGALDGIDLIIGGASDEFTSLFGGEDKTMAPDAFASTMKAAYGDGYDQAYKPASDIDAYRLFLRSMSDLALQKFILSAEYVKAHDKANAYVYYFNHTPPGRDHMFYGSYHSSELWYFFDSLRDKAGQRAWTPDDYAVADMISSYIADFVKTGDPNAKGLPEWKQCSASNGAAFMRWSERTSECVTTTPFPLRDKINRDAVMSTFGLSDGDLK